jgi:Ca2+-dependent lipid-binding protein
MDYQNLTKDRSLGTVEIQMAAFCQQTDDVRTPFHSTGLKSLREKIQLAKGSYKGELYFDVEFCPAVVRGLVLTVVLPY